VNREYELQTGTTKKAPDFSGAFFSTRGCF
jgi:hypothetical protein